MQLQGRAGGGNAISASNCREVHYRAAKFLDDDGAKEGNRERVVAPEGFSSTELERVPSSA